MQPKYRRGEILPLKEKLIFGIVTRYQVGYIPSVDICFTEDEENFIRDSYLFRPLKSKGLYIRPETQNVEDFSEGVSLSFSQEIQKLREYCDFTILPEDQADQYV